MNSEVNTVGEEYEHRAGVSRIQKHRADGGEKCYYLVYGNHFTRDPESIPDDATGVIFESCPGEDWCMLDGQKASPYMCRLPRDRENKEIFEQVIYPKKLTHYVVEPTFTTQAVGVSEAAIVIGEAITGTRLLCRGRMKKNIGEGNALHDASATECPSDRALQKQQSLTRRDLFRRAGAAYLLLPAFSEITAAASHLSGIGHRSSAALLNASNTLHPEQFRLVKQLRERVIAYKMWWITQNVPGQNKPAALLGGNHSSIEPLLRNAHPDGLLRGIRGMMQRTPFVRSAIIPRTFYSLVEWGYPTSGDKSIPSVYNLHCLEELKEIWDV